MAFFGFLVVKEPYTGQSTIETWVLPTKWGVHHVSTTNGYRDMEFWHFWRPRATPMHNTPGQTVDFFRNNPKMGFNLISYVPLPKKVIQTMIWSEWYSSIHPIFREFVLCVTFLCCILRDKIKSLLYFAKTVKCATFFWENCILRNKISCILRNIS